MANRKTTTTMDATSTSTSASTTSGLFTVKRHWSEGTHGDAVVAASGDSHHHSNKRSRVQGVMMTPTRRSSTDPAMMRVVATSPLRPTVGGYHINNNSSQRTSNHHNHQTQGHHNNNTTTSPTSLHYSLGTTAATNNHVLIQSPIQISRQFLQSDVGATSASALIPWHSPDRPHSQRRTTQTTSTTTIAVSPPRTSPPHPRVGVSPMSPPPPLLQQVAEHLRQIILEQQALQQAQTQQTQQQQERTQQLRKAAITSNPRAPPSTPLQWAKAFWSTHEDDEHGNNHLSPMPRIPTFPEEQDAVPNHRATATNNGRWRWVPNMWSTARIAPSNTVGPRTWNNHGSIKSLLFLCLACAAWSFFPSAVQPLRRLVALPLPVCPAPTNQTLRSLLTHPDGFSLAMAPAFFGFYGYFGALAAWEEAFGDNADADKEIVAATTRNMSNDDQQQQHHHHVWWYQRHIRSVAGASAGAMAAILLAAGTSPHQAVQLVANVTLDQFADFPGIAAVFRGDKFEHIMATFLRQQQHHHHHHRTGKPGRQLLRLEHGVIPVAVSAFDLQTWQGQILTRGSMAKAARASATFPMLFQPVAWKDDDDEQQQQQQQQQPNDYLLIDGGVTDYDGMQGLTALSSVTSKRLIVNMVVGDWTASRPTGPRDVPKLGNEETEFLSIRLQNLPPCGPWAMKNGPRAVEAAKRAMLAHLDVPLVKIQDRHYSLRIDASSYT